MIIHSAEDQHFNKCKFLNDNFLSVICGNKDVLEVGCFDGWITELVVQHNPKKLTLLESNSFSLDLIREKFPQAQVIHGDMHKDFDKVGAVDVALMLGVIYHSPAPLLVIEELVNHCRPNDVVIDNLSPAFEWRNEPSNVPGMRYTTNDMKTCNIVINIDNEIMITTFYNLGYRLITQSQYPNNARGPGAPIFHFTVNN
jgi:SAM-dependent methyltransferase